MRFVHMYKSDGLVNNNPRRPTPQGSSLYNKHLWGARVCYDAQPETWVPGTSSAKTRFTLLPGHDAWRSKRSPSYSAGAATALDAGTVSDFARPYRMAATTT